MTQDTLRNFGVDVEATDDEPPSYSYSRWRKALRKAPENAEPLDKLSCPWCLGSKDDFIVRTNDDVQGEVLYGRVVICGNCNAVIPVEADWYLRGEKICV